VILEETERAFLRQVGYYGAIRGLQRLIAATCSSTLWVVALNQLAYEFLASSLDLAPSFSHRINASNASRNHMRQAIMLRHNLSGLRLQFAPPPDPPNLAGRVKRYLRANPDPEATFFDSLSAEAVGVFRAAFEIWLGQIDRAAGGALYLKPLVSMNLSPIVKDLDLDDAFTLVAMMQHGSLTPEEHAIVFQASYTASRSQIDELVAREIVEPDLGRPGFRVRPEAVRIVHEALYRRNLL
jgi:hypothetical protein